MPINAPPEYYSVEKKYLSAETLEEKIFYLEELIRVAPKHKGAENLLKELKTRLKKFKEKLQTQKKSGKSSQKTIRKEHFQCALIGLPNSGKSSLLAKLTNARPAVADYPFTTFQPEVGTMDYEGVKAQIVDIPSIGSENFNLSITNTADCLLIIITSLDDLEKISPRIKKASGKKIIIFNKSDILTNEQKRKLEATMKSRKIDGLILSTKTGENISQLKNLIFKNMHVIRVYTKEPGKSPSNTPIVLPENSTIKDVAESIRKGFSRQIKNTKITGPSSKFPNQKVGLSHACKDKDIVEFQTR